MNARLSKSTALCLAVLYALLAGFGHALHTHDDCGSLAAESSAVASACSCGHSHPAPADPTPAPPASDHRQAWRPSAVAAPLHDCVACRLLHELGAGYAPAVAATEAASPLQAAPSSYDAPAVGLLLDAWSPRGPPLRVVS